MAASTAESRPSQAASWERLGGEAGSKRNARAVARLASFLGDSPCLGWTGLCGGCCVDEASGAAGLVRDGVSGQLGAAVKSLRVLVRRDAISVMMRNVVVLPTAALDAIRFCDPS